MFIKSALSVSVLAALLLLGACSQQEEAVVEAPAVEEAVAAPVEEVTLEMTEVVEEVTSEMTEVVQGAGAEAANQAEAVMESLNEAIPAIVQ